ncbi:hypothetical protein [Streptomyces shenzhenensis]|uniref:hypothetical protein n=1 Tax=Streptomyces shenzhenensis TaxID=943815 RepID=UPI0015F0B775|nr:hypothetical protein [Streptomyces shenzhenensis]
MLVGVADTRTAVPGSRWTVGEPTAHLALADELMADLAEGRERPDRRAPLPTLSVAP